MMRMRELVTRHQWEPAHVALLALSSAVVLLTLLPITDLDAYWHVLIGQQILGTRSLTDLGADWTVQAPSSPWHTTQWLAEAIMGGSVHAVGWAALLWLRLAMVVITIVTVLVVLLRRATAAASAVVLLGALNPGLHVFQERPLLASLPLCVWLGALSHDLLERQSRRLWPVFALTLLWANVHGLWVLAPAVLAAVAILLAIEQPGSIRQRIVAGRIAATAAVLALAGGLLTPLGFGSVIAPIRFHGSTAAIAEWQTVVAWSPAAWGLWLLLALMVVAWVTGRRPARVGTVGFTMLVVAFGLSAYRNLMPAGLLLAPLVAAHASSLPWLRRRPTTPERATALAVVAGVLVIAITLGAVVITATTDPLGRAQPLSIARALAKETQPVRVFNSYNASGVLLAFGGPSIQLAIDGRADRYGNARIQQHIRTENLQGNWQADFASADANYAVIGNDSPLAYELTTHRGWKRLRTDGEYVLLKAPPSAN